MSSHGPVLVIPREHASSAAQHENEKRPDTCIEAPISPGTH